MNIQTMEKLAKPISIVTNVIKCTEKHHLSSCVVAETVSAICKYPLSKFPIASLAIQLDDTMEEHGIVYQGKEYIADLVDYIIDNFPNIDIAGPITVFFGDKKYDFSTRETQFIRELIRAKYNTLSVYTQIERNIEELNRTKKFYAERIDDMLKIELLEYPDKKLYKSTTVCPPPPIIQPVSVVGGSNNYCVMVPIYSTGNGFTCCLL